MRALPAILLLGYETAVIGDLERLAREHPYHERLHGQLMLALYRAGRQADALAAFREVRARLAAALRIERSGELARLASTRARAVPASRRVQRVLDLSARALSTAGDR